MEGRVPAVVAMVLLVMVVGVLGGQTSSTPNDYLDCLTNTCPKSYCTGPLLFLREACSVYCAARCAVSSNNLVEEANHYCNLGCTSFKCDNNKKETAAGGCINACSHICATTKHAAALA